MKTRLVCLSQCVKDASLREGRLFVSKDDLAGENIGLLEKPGVIECVILSTCLRFEIYAAVKDSSKPERPLTEHLRGSPGAEPGGDGAPLSVMRDAEAARHLFAVVCGLDSTIIGEKEIAGQVRHAYRTAHGLGCTGPLLNRLFQKALNVSKKVRTGTGIDRGACSAASLAVRLLREARGDLRSKRILILGAGQMAKLVGLHLSAKGCADICFSSRSVERARAVAGQCSARCVPFSRFFESLRDCDILVTATGAPHTIIDYSDMEGVMAQRRGRELCVVDLADPPDVDRRVASMENVCCFTINRVDELASETEKRRAAAAREARDMIEEAVADCDFLPSVHETSITRKLAYP